MVSAIVLAAGSGSRMKSDKAKQFMELEGKPLIYYALKVFEASIVDEIILVTRQQDINTMREDVVKKYGFTKVKRIVAGGKERYDSVENGLKACDRRAAGPTAPAKGLVLESVEYPKGAFVSWE